MSLKHFGKIVLFLNIFMQPTAFSAKPLPSVFRQKEMVSVIWSASRLYMWGFRFKPYVATFICDPLLYALLCNCVRIYTEMIIESVTTTNYETRAYTVMVNNFSNINKTNTRLSSQYIKRKDDHDIWHWKFWYWISHTRFNNWIQSLINSSYICTFEVTAVNLIDIVKLELPFFVFRILEWAVITIYPFQ
jgi:hypothetical protein